MLTSADLNTVIEVTRQSHRCGGTTTCREPPGRTTKRRRTRRAAKKRITSLRGSWGLCHFVVRPGGSRQVVVPRTHLADSIIPVAIIQPLADIREDLAILVERQIARAIGLIDLHRVNLVIAAGGDIHVRDSSGRRFPVDDILKPPRQVLISDGAGPLGLLDLLSG